MQGGILPLIADRAGRGAIVADGAVRALVLRRFRAGRAPVDVDPAERASVVFGSAGEPRYQLTELDGALICAEWAGRTPLAPDRAARAPVTRTEP